MHTVEEKVRSLPPELQEEVSAFIDSLLAQRTPSDATTEPNPRAADDRPLPAPHGKSLVRQLAAMRVEDRQPYLNAAFGAGEPEATYDRDWVDLDEDTDY
jgi:hypothetical protein